MKRADKKARRIARREASDRRGARKYVLGCHLWATYEGRNLLRMAELMRDTIRARELLTKLKEKLRALTPG